ncbi:sporulation membrane protein YtaF [Egbenema bharatensis]|uniref:sporulation membrane protein YtaF n=1 Tax=Egbenema bharatensis TaxID=3463334 RepID=UPI003A87E9C2
MNVFSLLILAIAVSLDSFGIGVAYGVRRISVPVGSLIVITVCTMLTLLLAVGTGGAVVAVISPELTEAIGGFLLMGIGVFAILNQLKAEFFDRSQASKPDRALESSRNRRQSHRFPIKSISAILRNPVAADFDRSSSISVDEAFVLGVAVSLDSFIAGMGIRLLGYSPWLIIIILSLMSSGLIYFGIRLGIAISEHRWTKQLPYFPGTLLIIIGVHRLI